MPTPHSHATGSLVSNAPHVGTVPTVTAPTTLIGDLFLIDVQPKVKEYRTSLHKLYVSQDKRWQWLGDHRQRLTNW